LSSLLEIPSCVFQYDSGWTHNTVEDRGRTVYVNCSGCGSRGWWEICPSFDVLCVSMFFSLPVVTVKPRIPYFSCVRHAVWRMYSKMSIIQTTCLDEVVRGRQIGRDVGCDMIRPRLNHRAVIPNWIVDRQFPIWRFVVVVIVVSVLVFLEIVCVIEQGETKNPKDYTEWDSTHSKLVARPSPPHSPTTDRLCRRVLVGSTNRHPLATPVQNDDSNNDSFSLTHP